MRSAASSLAAGAVGAAVGAAAALWWARRARRRAEQMVLLAVSGTIEDGFELRGNIDAPGRPAVFVGSGLVRGVAMHLDVKDAACRERVTPDGAARPRVNPAMVPTGDPAATASWAAACARAHIVERQQRPAAWAGAVCPAESTGSLECRLFVLHSGDRRRPQATIAALRRQRGAQVAARTGGVAEGSGRRRRYGQAHTWA